MTDTPKPDQPSAEHEDLRWIEQTWEDDRSPAAPEPSAETCPRCGSRSPLLSGACYDEFHIGALSPAAPEPSAEPVAFFGMGGPLDPEARKSALAAGLAHSAQASSSAAPADVPCPNPNCGYTLLAGAVCTKCGAVAPAGREGDIEQELQKYVETPHMGFLPLDDADIPVTAGEVRHLLRRIEEETRLRVEAEDRAEAAERSNLFLADEGFRARMTDTEARVSEVVSELGAKLRQADEDEQVALRAAEVAERRVTELEAALDAHIRMRRHANVLLDEIAKMVEEGTLSGPVLLAAQILDASIASISGVRITDALSIQDPSTSED